MGTHPIFESDFDCLTEMSLAELAKRHREKGGNRDSGSRLTLGDTKKKESKRSGALSLSDLLNKKKNNSTDQPKKPILSNLKNLVSAKAVSSESTKDQPQSQVRSILKIEEKVEKLSIQDKTTSRSKLAVRSSRLSTALAWPKGASRKRTSDQIKDQPHTLDFRSQVSLFDEVDH